MVGCGFSYYKVTFSYIFAKVKIHFKKTNIFYDFSQCVVQKRTVYFFTNIVYGWSGLFASK